MDHQGVEFVPLPWVTLHWAVGVLLYKGQLQDNRSHCLTQGFFQGKDISAIIIRRTAYELEQVTYMYTLVEERHVYKTLINSYVRPWASRSSPIARGGGNGKPPPHLHFPCPSGVRGTSSRVWEMSRISTLA